MGKLFNLARMTTATTGTGTITLGSAVSGYLSFAAAGVSDSDVVTYAISDGANSEIGTGTYTASGTTLTRSVIKSTNSDAAINLSGTAEVFVTAAAEDIARLPGTPDHRLTLTSATPVTTSAVTSAGTVYWTPYTGNTAWLYTGAAWRQLAIDELSIALSGGTASRPHDVFVDYNAGSPQLVLGAWTNATTRATALTRQDGRLVLSGATDHLYVGTIYIDGSKQCADSAGGTNTRGLRHVWNMYNRRVRPMVSVETTSSWSYTTTTWRRMNNNSNIECSFVCGLDDDAVDFVANQAMTSTSTPACGIGFDWSSGAPNTSGVWSFGAAGDAFGASTSRLVITPTVGLHTVQPLEYGNLGCTFYGGNTGFWNCGITGTVWG